MAAAVAIVACSVAMAAKAEKDPGAAAVGEAARLGRLLKLRLPLSAESERLVKRFATRTLDEARRHKARPVLIFEFDVPSGEEEAGRGSQFGASLEIAKFLSSKELSGATTVAYLPRPIEGHAVLAAIACDEIIMAPQARIGRAGIDSRPIDDVMRAAYRDIARRRRTVPVEVALGMLDPAQKVLEVKTELSREFVTPEQLDALKDRHTITSESVLIPAGEAGVFEGDEARQLGFVSFLADSRVDVARALELQSEQIEEDVQLADTWKAVRIDVEGLVTPEKVERIQGLIRDAVDRDVVNFICLWIDSAGGAPVESANLAKYLTDLPGDRVRTVAYIPEKARGDASLVAMGCDQVVMRSGAVLGGSGDDVMSREAIEQAVVGIRERARRQSRSWSLPAAMIDPELKVYRCWRADTALIEYFCDQELREQPDAGAWKRDQQPVTRPGQLFQANGMDAQKYYLANHVVESFAEFKEIYGLEDDPALAEPGWADMLVRMLASPGVAIFLLIVGGAALYAELHTPGVGLGGFLAIVCFVLFFWSQYLGENAAWLEVLLFLMGLVCLLIEVFVLPGFGVFGVGGGVLILISLVLATQTFFLPRNEYQFHQFRISLMIVASAGAGVVGMAFLLNRWLPHAPVLNRLMLMPPEGDEKAFIAQSETMIHLETLVGRQGVTTTQLTPSGKARFGQKLVDVIADGELIEPGTRITVVEVHGSRVMVEPVEEEE